MQHISDLLTEKTGQSKVQLKRADRMFPGSLVVVSA
jgi:hypothetical protein